MLGHHRFSGKYNARTYFGKINPRTFFLKISRETILRNSHVQSSNSHWEALFCNVDGVRVPKQPWLESPVLQRGWGTCPKTAKAGKLCFATWMGCEPQNKHDWKTLFYNVYGVHVPKHTRLGSPVLQHGWVFLFC